MKRFLTSKWLIIIAVSIGLVVFNTLVFNVSIVKRNIVVGIGLDYENGEYTLLTQVVLPKNGGVTSGGNNYVTLKANAQNIDIAIDKIEKTQGVVLSFAQSAILILGKNMVKEGNLDLVDTFFMDDRVHDNMLLVMAQEKAEDVLNAKVPAGEVASLQLVAQLRPTKAPLEVAAISLQEYVRNSKNINKINYMPLVSVEEAQPSTDQSKENSDEADKLLISQTAIMDSVGLLCELNEDMTQSFNLAKKKMQDGVLKVDGEEIFSVHIVESKSQFEYDFDETQCTVKVKLKTIRTEARQNAGKISFKLSEDELVRLILSVDNRINSLFDYCLEQNIDIFSIRDGFLKKFPKMKEQILADDFLNKIKINVEVKINQAN